MVRRTIVYAALVSFIAPVAWSAPERVTAGPIEFIFPFGDSYTDLSFSFSGTKPTVGNQLGNPPFPGASSAHGPNWLDWLTVNFSSPRVLSFDMAMNGAVTTNTLCTPFEPTVFDISQQVNITFMNNLASHPSFAPWTPSNALFTFAIGVNDVLCSQGAGNNSQIAAKNTAILDFYFAGVETLFNAGARNFLFLGSPAVELAPLRTAAGPEVVAEQFFAVNDYNEQLVARIDQFRLSHEPVFTTFFNTSTVYRTVSAHANEFGLKDNTTFCAAYATGENTDANDPSCAFPVAEFFWKDNLHPTFVVHEQVAKGIGPLINWLR